MLSKNLGSLSSFFRFNKLLASRQLYRLKCCNRSEKTLEKYLKNWKLKRNGFKTFSITATIGFGTYACSFISKKSDSLLENESEDELDQLFSEEILKENLELLKKYGNIPYLIIGSGPAAIAAYHAIRINDPVAKVLLVCEEHFYPYRHSILSNELWYLKNHDQSVIRERLFYNEYYLSVQQMLENKNGGLALIQGKKVLHIDPISQVVTLDSDDQIAYDKCLLASDPKPKNLPTFEETEEDIQKNLTLFHSLRDFLKLENISRNVKSIAVIGGGLLGSQLASGLKEYNESTGLKVIQIFPESQLLNNILPTYLSKWIMQSFQNKGIHVVPNVHVKAVEKNNNKLELHLSNDETVSVDHVVLAVGTEPNTEMAVSSGLETDDELGGYIVNAEMKARKNLWIAGNTSFYDIKVGRRRMEKYEDADHSGYLAGENMTGKGKPVGFQSDWWSVLSSDVFCEGVGEIDAKLETVGVFEKSLSNNATELSQEISTNIVTSEEQNNANKSVKGNFLEDYHKGLVFYLRDNVIVGILLWNVVTHLRIVKQVIRECKQSEDIAEIAKMFIYPTKVNEETTST